MESNTIKKSSARTNVGISLVIVGVPLGMYLNYLYPITAVKWSPIIMLLSILFIISYSNLLKLKFPSYNKLFTVVLLFQLLMLFYGILSDRMTGQYASFHFYVVSLCIALSTNKRDLYYNNLIISIFIISALCVILGAVFLWQGLVVGEDVWELKQEIEYYALEPFTVASGAVTNLICILFLFNNKRNKFYHSCLLKIINQI